MKGLAVPYIIAILFGVVILGVIGYWMFSQSGKAFGTGTKTECDANRRSFCVFWKNTGFLKSEPFTWDIKCGEKPSKYKCATEILDLGCTCWGPEIKSCYELTEGEQPIDYGISCVAGSKLCCKE